MQAGGIFGHGLQLGGGDQAATVGGGTGLGGRGLQLGQSGGGGLQLGQSGGGGLQLGQSGGGGGLQLGKSQTATSGMGGLQLGLGGGGLNLGSSVGGGLSLGGQQRTTVAGGGLQMGLLSSSSGQTAATRPQLPQSGIGAGLASSLATSAQPGGILGGIKPQMTTTAGGGLGLGQTGLTGLQTGQTGGTSLTSTPLQLGTQKPGSLGTPSLGKHTFQYYRPPSS